MYKKLNILGDRCRLQIIEEIRKESLKEDQESCGGKNLVCACRMLENLECSQSTLSHHLKVLTENNILKREKIGKYYHYQINEEEIDNIITFFEGLKRGN